MIRPSHARPPGRRGATAVEMAIVLPMFMLLAVGTILGGLKVSRYQRVAALARAGSRWASTHGPTYSSEANVALITGADVLNAIRSQMGIVGFDSTKVACTMTPSPMTTADRTVTVKVTYQEPAQAYFPASTTSSTSVMPITY